MKLSRLQVKTSGKTQYTVLRIGGTTYKVPKHRAKKFREAMGEPRPQRKSLVRNQWTAKPYRYEA